MTVHNYEVSHPAYGTVVVPALGADGATVAAAKVWGADWGKVAGSCAVRKLGVARQPRCRRCKCEFGDPGGAAAYCPACERALELQRREAATIGRSKRRGYV